MDNLTEKINSNEISFLDFYKHMNRRKEKN